MEFICAFTAWIILAVIVGNLGSSRNIGSTGAFFISLLFSPIIGLLVVLASDKKEDDDVKEKPYNFRDHPNYKKKVNAQASNIEKESHQLNEPKGDKYDKLKRIGELKEKGVLTEQEFEAEKKKILES